MNVPLFYKGCGKCVHKAGDFYENYETDDFLGVRTKMAMDLCKMNFSDRNLEKVRRTFKAKIS